MALSGLPLVGVRYFGLLELGHLYFSTCYWIDLVSGSVVALTSHHCYVGLFVGRKPCPDSSYCPSCYSCLLVGVIWLPCLLLLCYTGI